MEGQGREGRAGRGRAGERGKGGQDREGRGGVGRWQGRAGGGGERGEGRTGLNTVFVFSVIGVGEARGGSRGCRDRGTCFFVSFI